MSAPTFPLHRKLLDGRRWYRVEAPDRLIEVERIGGRYIRHDLVALQYPERVRIAAIIAGEGGHADCSEAEFMAVLDRSSLR